MSAPLLHIDNVTRSFGGVTAVAEVTMTIEPGQRVGLIGPNGAGKSTLVNCVAGSLRPSMGDVLLEGRNLRGVAAEKRSRQGISRTFQNLELFVSMTALENVVIAIDGAQSRWQSMKRGNAREVRHRALEALQMLGIEGYADVPVAELPYGVRKLIELSRAFVTRPKLLLLDEPVAGLSDTDEFLEILHNGIDELGCAVLLVEHDMPTVQRLADYVYVLDTGRLIASGSYHDVSRNPQVIEAYLGREAPVEAEQTEEVPYSGGRS